jgi:RNA polymerase sigma-70 factor (ECF subfamily)
MAGDETREALIARAVAGEQYAFQLLLLEYYDRLAGTVGRRLPGSLRGILGVEDVLQGAFARAWGSVRRFRPGAPDAFYRWLALIARRELRGLVRAERAAKRDHRRRAGGVRADGASGTVADLVELVAVHHDTPSRKAAGHEREQALREALGGLPEAYRRVLQLRYFQGLSVAAAAAELRCSEGAVMMRCQRALEKLREALGSASRYLSGR